MFLCEDTELNVWLQASTISLVLFLVQRLYVMQNVKIQLHISQTNVTK